MTLHETRARERAGEQPMRPVQVRGLLFFWLLFGATCGAACCGAACFGGLDATARAAQKPKPL